MPVRIGELLLKEKRITSEQLQEALNYQKANGGKLGVNLVKLGYVTDDEIISLLRRQYNVPSIDLSSFEVDPAVIKLVPAETAQKYQVLPLSRSGATLTIAMTDPTNVFAMDDIKFMTGYNVEPVVASETAVVEAIARYYSLPAKSNGNAQPSALEFAADHASDLLEFLHQVALGVKPACSVYEQVIDLSGPCRRCSVVHNSGRVRPLLLTDELRSCPSGPNLELLDRGGAESVGCRHHDSIA